MGELLDLDFWLLLWLFLGGIVGYIISTIGGGGGSLLLVPLVNAFLTPRMAAPVLNLGAFIGRPVRLVLFWKEIQWPVVLYYAPAALAGAFLSGWLFSELQLEWLQGVVALFLISTIFQYRFGKQAATFRMKHWYFVPLGFGIAFLSTLVGAVGPVLNPFYLNAGIDKEEMIATKTANSFLMGVVQIGTYAFFGELYGQLWVYGAALGLGATFGNVIGKQLLKRMSKLHFRRAVIIVMVISGVAMLVPLVT